MDYKEEKEIIERIEDTFYQDNGKGIKRFKKITLYEDGILDIFKLLKIVEKKNKQIDLIVEYINYLSDELVKETGKNELQFCDMERCLDNGDIDCTECIKQYIEKKLKEEN